MAIARKTPAKPVKPAPAVKSVKLSVDQVIPALQESLDATLSKAEEVQETVRRTTEEGVEQTRRMYERVKVVTEEATSTLETSYAKVSKGFSEINLKALEAMKANADAHFAFMKALMSTKSVSEAIALQSDHARVQLEVLQAQARELSELIRQVTAETVEPIKTTLTKTFQAAA